MAGQSRQGKVLCIRVIQGKNVLDKTIDAGESVTVGEGAKNTFVFPQTKLGADFQLFKAVGNGYVLRFTEAMRGKVEARGAVVKLPQLYADDSVAKKGGVAQLPLTEQDRGKLKIDSVTVLFQFLPPPPAQALKPIQQMDFRPRLLSDDDPMFLGFLAIWTAFATMLVIWVWNTEPKEYNLEEIPDRFAKVIMPEEKKAVLEPDEPDDEQVDEEPMGSTPIEEVPQPEAAPQPTEKPTEVPKTEVEQFKQQEQRKDEIVQKSALLQMLATTGESSGGVVSNVWAPDDEGTPDLDAALSEKEVVADSAKLRDTTTKAGTEAVDVEVGGVGGGNAKAEVSGPAVSVKPRVRAETGNIDVSGDEGEVKDVVRKYTGQLTYCYEKRLKAVPTLEGRIEVGWTVASGAVVGSPYVIFNGTGDKELADCITKKIRRWSFPADVEGELSWPFAFQAKK